MKFHNIFIAGQGFLGTRVAKRFKEEEIDFRTLSLRDGFDFRNFDQTNRLFEDSQFDLVINCAAYIGGVQLGFEKPADLYYNNILMSTYLMESARRNGVKRFINPIGNCSYPSQLNKDFKEKQWWDGPLDDSVLAFGFAKKATWVQSWAYYEQYGFETINLILPNMYGPNDHFDEVRSHALVALIMKFVSAKEKNFDEVVVWGTGTPIREWLYVDDAVEIILKSMHIKYTNKPINVGVGKGISIIDLAELIKEIVGYKGKITLDTTKPDGAPYKTMDNSRLIEHFNWEPQMSLKKGIKKTVEWYLNNKK